MATKEEEAGSTTDPVYKTKIVQFLGRTTPIVLQNENGPCPLLAICNVLLLRNVINLSGDESEVTQQRLLSLVAERLIDSNSNIQGKDESYVNNQQQNIADAIDLLPQLARGLDVNMHFEKINDFEFTRECAIFDLLDIALYHGWIVDPQDAETASAIGSKSYNTLVAELVNKISESTQSTQSKVDFDQDEDGQTVDFAAATTAALGVPCPSLSRGLSFEDNNNKKIKKGDLEEERELDYILDISRSQQSDPVTDSAELAKPKVDIFAQNYENGDDKDEGLTFPRLELEGSSSLDMNQFVMDKTGDLQSVVRTGEDNEFVKTGEANEYEKTGGVQLDGKTGDDNEFEKTGGVQSVVKTDEDTELGKTGGVQSVVKTDDDTDLGKTGGVQSDVKTGEVNDRTGGAQLIDRTGEDSGFLNGQGVVDEEPIYQGEEHILNNHIYNININNNDVNNNDDDNNDKRDLEYESPEPVYEGEVVLAEQFKASDEPQDHQWQLIKHFLESNASQLTIYGLFCLQEGLKERELCVFFRNNHFSTMFKYNGELYLLATDQGYIHQLDLVWEKLNEVNGDTVFMTGNFTPFKAENNRGNESWNQHEAMTNTADYLAALESTDPSVSVTNSDLQLAIALQQQEFDQQQQQQQNRQQQQQQNRQQQQPSPQRAYPVPPPGSGRSRLVVGPAQAQQRPATNPSQRTSEPKLKEKCTIM